MTRFDKLTTSKHTETPFTGKLTIETVDTKYPDIKEYKILQPNPNASKSGVSFSGSHFAVCYLDSKECAEYIIKACNNYEKLVEAIREYYDDTCCLGWFNRELTDKVSNLLSQLDKDGE